MDEPNRRGPRNPHRGSHREPRLRAPDADALKKWPLLMRMAIYQVEDLLTRKRGHWGKFSRDAIVAGYPWARAFDRTYSLRKDGAAAVRNLLVTLLRACDIRTGFIGRPLKGSGGWARYTMEDLAYFAYGVRDDSAVRQARRALDVIINLGWAQPTKRVDRYDKETHQVRAEPGVRYLNLKKLCQDLGIPGYYDRAWEVAKAKYVAQREKVRRRVAREREQAIAQARLWEQHDAAGGKDTALGWETYGAALSLSSSAHTGDAESPPSTGDPPPHIDAIKLLIDV